MSDLLDDLARQIAEPMPRRRAMRLLLAGAAGAALPSLRPGRAFARRGLSCPDPGFTPCVCPGPTPTTHFQLCCPPDYQCLCQPDAAECHFQCPNPCGPNCCESGQTCVDPSTGHCCPTGTTGCGSICCGAGETCADPGIELCCKKGAKPCRGGNTVNCCKPNAACCEGHCCGPKHRCHEGECKKCPPYTRVCGDKHCCEHGQACCDGQCCDFGEICASVAGSKVCCPRDRVLRTRRGRACCPPGKIARDGACCPPKGPCDTCDEIACLPGTYCINGTCYRL